MTSLQIRQVALAGRLQPTDLDVPQGQLVAVVGPNGGGKTSLLRAIARVEHASGSVHIGGEQVDSAGEARRRHLLGFLPASRDIAWPISVRDVIALGLGRDDPGQVAELVHQFELTELVERPVDRLSTGERTRVLLARVLAARPRLLLLDEPLSNLDPYWVLRVLDLLRALACEGQMLLVSLHGLEHLPRFDRVLLVADGAIRMDEAPKDLVADERFGEIFRIDPSPDGGWAIRP
jgi:iron complex transport system ATP-binding protein